MDIAALLEGCRAGDTDAVEAFVEQYYAPVFRVALSVLDDAAEADEAAQDTLVSALGALSGFRGEAEIMTWLYRIAVNKGRSRLRRRQARERLLGAVRSLFLVGRERADPEDTAIRNETQAAVWRAVQALDEKRRLAMLLYYYHDLPVGEIARVLGISEPAVYSRLESGREQLRRALSAEVR